MNYRHIYHAGNFADVMKHALLLRLLAAMQRKPKPFLVLDTHAGIGRYDVTSEQAEKTGEWREGIGKILETPPSALAEYVATVKRLGLYPGSPVFTAEVLRPQDRLVACELHPEDAATLRRTMRLYENAAMHERDGYEALGAFLPPPEKRALVLIDPPFERTDEFSAAAATLAKAWKKFPSGVYVIWYPIKHRAPVRHFFEALKLAGIKDVIAAELLRRPDTDPTKLNGAGLGIINPPYGFEAEAAPILAACLEAFGEAGASAGIERIISE
ncbi:MAG: 23S rRNA (adenine(2030)-N(6))-methyltransferase RlmJ [Rhodospirillales bacterium]|nr:23S rRNA (adenine(2030)-N(6))-methyltransferase RlmJ [Rhodospirillales bacterium]MDE2390525.1 23S rRNA (adenine(2030)-N(6))-methyltransferase RlmJ [Rhodospirillales bacterium]